MRSLAPVALAVTALCAWLDARGISALVAPALLTSPLAVSAPAPLAALGRERSPSADPILARNPFDSITGPLTASPAPESPSDVRCDDVRVVAIAAFDDPAWSLAMLDVRGQREPVLRRTGGEVASIGFDRVVLDRDGRRCVARLFDRATSAAPAVPVPSKTRGIERTGASSFAVDRAARDSILADPSDLMRAVRVAPEMRDGDVVGMRIVALRSGTALDALGVRAGDVLSSLDGIPLTAPDRLVEAFAHLRTRDAVRLVVVRDGKELQLDYEVK